MLQLALKLMSKIQATAVIFAGLFTMITEDGDTMITEDGDTFITES